LGDDRKIATLHKLAKITVLVFVLVAIPSTLSVDKNCLLIRTVQKEIERLPFYNWSKSQPHNHVGDCSGMMYWITRPFQPFTRSDLEKLVQELEKILEDLKKERTKNAI
jgi:hypothetical protein